MPCLVDWGKFKFRAPNCTVYLPRDEIHRFLDDLVMLMPRLRRMTDTMECDMIISKCWTLSTIEYRHNFGFRRCLMRAWYAATVHCACALAKLSTLLNLYVPCSGQKAQVRTPLGRLGLKKELTLNPFIDSKWMDSRANIIFFTYCCMSLFHYDFFSQIRLCSSTATMRETPLIDIQGSAFFFHSRKLFWFISNKYF